MTDTNYDWANDIVDMDKIDNTCSMDDPTCDSCGS